MRKATAAFCMIIATQLAFANTERIVIKEDDVLRYEINKALVQEAGYTDDKEKRLIATRVTFTDKIDGKEINFDAYVEKASCFNRKGKIIYRYTNGKPFNEYEFDFSSEKYSEMTSTAWQMCLIYNSAE
ncbi:hypothetical protein H0A66_05965 [Alcaligenaceae bacterium]|nr:hypothetical protein [Alcaligenaceae bacterium]